MSLLYSVSQSIRFYLIQVNACFHTWVVAKCFTIDFPEGISLAYRLARTYLLREYDGVCVTADNSCGLPGDPAPGDRSGRGAGSWSWMLPQEGLVVTMVNPRQPLEVEVDARCGCPHRFSLPAGMLIFRKQDW